MKLLYNVILLLSILQLNRASYSESSNSENIISPKKQLMRFYRREFNLLAAEICLKLEDVSSQILEDYKVEQASTPLMQEFNKNITHFKIFQPFYSRFGLNEALAIKFSNMVESFYYSPSNGNKDTRYIRQLLRKLGYDEVREKYAIELKKFYLEKFIPKFNQLKTQISNKSQLEKFVNRFQKCISKSLECENYECFLNNFRRNALKIRDQFVGNLQRYFFDVLVTNLHNVTVACKEIAKDPRVSKLSPEIRSKIANFSNVNFDDFTDFRDIFAKTGRDPFDWIMFDHMLDMSPKEMRILTEIFKKYDHNPLALKVVYMNLSTYFIKEAERFKTTFSQAELQAEDNSFWKIIDNVNESSSNGEILEAQRSLGALDNDELKKWRL